MIEITIEEYNEMTKVRIEEDKRGYLYSLVKFDEDTFGTVSRYLNGPFSLQKIKFINLEGVRALPEDVFRQDHAAIHVTPSKHAKKWRVI